jgi:hypothetical protein
MLKFQLTSLFDVKIMKMRADYKRLFFFAILPVMNDPASFRLVSVSRETTRQNSKQLLEQSVIESDDEGVLSDYASQHKVETEQICC